MKIQKFLIAGIVVVVTPIFAGILFFLNLSPKFDAAAVFQSNDKTQSGPIELSFDIGDPHFLVYETTGDIRQFHINGVAVRTDTTRIDLRSGLYSNCSNCRVTIEKHEKLARFGIRPSMSDSKIKVLLLTVSLVTLLVLFAMMRIAKLDAHHRQFMLFFALGSLARFWCYLGTPWWVRAHDAIDHAQYISYLINNRAIPDFHDGWQFYQPPAYHILAALWSHFIHLLVPLQPILSYEVMQSLNVFVSIFTLFFALLIGLEIFDETEQRSLFKYYCTAFTFFPGLIYLAGQICNDALTQLFLIATTWALMRWWHTSKLGFWWASLLLSILGLLSKTNSAVILSLVFLLLMVKKQIVFKKRIIMLFAGIALCVLLTGPLFLERIHQGQKHLVGNLVWNLPGLYSKDDITSYVVFDPVQVISMVYNKVTDESGRRRFVWEFLLRSALFGEHPLRDSGIWLSRSLLVLYIQMLLVALYGLTKDVSRRFYGELPMHLILAGGLCSVALIRVIYHVSLFADFRYCAFIMVPICYFYCRGIAACTGTLQYVLKVLAWLTYALSIAMLSFNCFS